LRAYTTANSSTLVDFSDQTEVSIGGIIELVSIKSTRKGERMCFTSIQDLEGKCEVVVFPDVFKKAAALLNVDALVFVKGKINAREDETKIVASEFIPLQEVRSRLTKVFTVDLFTAGLEQETLERLKEILIRHKGNVPVHLNFKEPSGKCTQVIVGEDIKINAADDLFDEIEGLLGEHIIKITT